METRRIGGRLIIGVVIALVGVFIYMSRVEKNPVTGAKQHVSLTTEQEIRLGLQAAPEMARELGGEISAEDPRTLVVMKLGDHLVKKSLAEKSPWQFQFHLLADESTVNAFALPGGQVFITLGLLNKLATEAELAGVLGHEIGHVIERHTAEQMAKHELGQTMVIAVGTAASDRAQSAYAIAALVNHMVQLRYGRKDELESDTWGVRLMTENHYNPQAMINVMNVLKAASKHGGSIDLFQTHPNPDLRIDDINDYLKKHPESAGLRSGHALTDLYANPSLVGQVELPTD